MLRHLVDVNVEEVKAAAQQLAADLGYSSLKTSTRGGSCPVCNTSRCICSTSNRCHTCCSKLIAFLQNKLGYWSVTRPFLLARGRPATPDYSRGGFDRIRIRCASSKCAFMWTQPIRIGCAFDAHQCAHVKALINVQWTGLNQVWRCSHWLCIKL